MNDFSMDFAFDGFRFAAKKPGVVAVWGLIMTLLVVVFEAALFSAMGTHLPALQTGASDPAETMKFLSAIGPIYGGGLPVITIVSAIMLCAAFRATLRPEQKGFAYLRFGGDEFRMIGLFLLMFLLSIVFVVILVIGISAAALGLKAMGGGATGLIGVVLGIALVFGLIWLSVRCVLIAPHVFATGKFDLMGGFKLTQGRFWTFFLGYLVMFLVSMAAVFAIEIIAAVIALIILMATGGFGSIDAIKTGHMPPMPAMIGFGLVGVEVLLAVIFMYGLLISAQYIPAASAYKILTEKKTFTF